MALISKPLCSEAHPGAHAAGVVRVRGRAPAPSGWGAGRAEQSGRLRCGRVRAGAMALLLMGPKIP